MNSPIIPTEYYLPIGVVCAVIILVLLIYFLGRRQRGVGHYRKKDRLLSATEIEYYKVLEDLYGDRYIILPQINLASVIEKEDPGYRTELFRNVDFGVFDGGFRPILLIEINDGTHLRPDRQERDKRVGLIARRAGLPLVTFWTRDGIRREEIKRTLSRWLR